MLNLEDDLKKSDVAACDPPVPCCSFRVVVYKQKKKRNLAHTSYCIEFPWVKKKKKEKKKREESQSKFSSAVQILIIKLVYYIYLALRVCLRVYVGEFVLRMVNTNLQIGLFLFCFISGPLSPFQ